MLLGQPTTHVTSYTSTKLIELSHRQTFFPNIPNYQISGPFVSTGLYCCSAKGHCHLTRFPSFIVIPVSSNLHLFSSHSSYKLYSIHYFSSIFTKFSIYLNSHFKTVYATLVWKELCTIVIKECIWLYLTVFLKGSKSLLLTRSIVHQGFSKTTERT